MTNKIATFKKHLLAATGMACLLCFACLPSAAHAQEKNTKTPPAIESVDFAAIESIGLYTSPEEGSLGNGMYQGADRASLSALIEDLPAESSLNALEKLTNDMLLSAANAAFIENSTDIKDGADLLTLRIEKLLQRGLIKQAYGIASKIGDDQYYHPRLSRAIVLSMLFGKEKGLACLQSKALNNRFTSEPFWKTLDAYCTLSLSDQPEPNMQDTINASGSAILKSILADPEYKFPYTKETFEKLSMLEQAALVADNRISLTALSEDELKNITAPHIETLLQNTDLTPQQHLLLLSEAVEKGVLPAARLTEELQSIAKTLEKDKRAPVGMEELAALKKESSGFWNGDTRKTAIQKSLSYAKTFNPALLIPFLDVFEDIKNPAQQFTPDQIELVLRAHIIAGKTLHKNWLDSITDIKADQDSEKYQKDKLALAAALLSPPTDDKTRKAPEILTLESQEKTFHLLSFKNIIENIDNPTTSRARVPYIYEKGFDLARNKSYTMPPYVLISELESVAEHGVVAETIALSNLVFSGSETNGIYPGVLLEAYKSFEKIGFKKQAREMMAQAILDLK